MNDLCTDVGYKSIYHYGEELCGDHVDVIDKDNESIIVLADGLGSGVKASILSTLTSKIISTMLAEGISLEECVKTIMATLPVCSVRGVAYSTFTIVRIVNNTMAEVIQYDNPHVILLRDFVNYDYPKEEVIVGDKTLYRSMIRLQENDTFILMSDGCPHAGIGLEYNMGWQRENIIQYMEAIASGEFTAKNLAAMLVDEVDRLYGHEPGDDATACVIRVRKRVPMNILFGPPRSYDDNERMMDLFFSKEGKHIVCGGTTSSIAAKYLGKPVRVPLSFGDSDLPPIASIEGVDLVTEGVITINKVIEYANDYIGENKLYEEWNFKTDAATMIARMLFEEATDINFYVGRAINPAHQNPDLPINFSIKMNLVEELTKALKVMGKRIKVSYF